MSIIKRKAGSEDIVKSVLEFDSVPTEGSHNLVESGAVAQAIGNIGQPLQWKGPATVAQLNAGITGIQPGWTYTLTDAGTLTDGSIAVNAGNEVAWTEDGEWFKVGGDFSKIVPEGTTPENPLVNESALAAVESSILTKTRSVSFTANNAGQIINLGQVDDECWLHFDTQDAVNISGITNYYAFFVIRLSDGVNGYADVVRLEKPAGTSTYSRIRDSVYIPKGYGNLQLYMRASSLTKPYLIWIDKVPPLQVHYPSFGSVKSVAHRGGVGRIAARENTTAEMRLAAIYGYKFVETDLHTTSDGHVVCFHDDAIPNLGNIADLTLAQVKTYKPSGFLLDSTIPTLEELLQVCKEYNLHPYLEIKGGGNTTASAAIAIVADYGMMDNVTWLCFTASYLQTISTAYAKSRLGLLGASIDASLVTAAQALKNGNNEVFLDVNDASNYALARAENIPVEVWTVSDFPAQHYVSGLTTNNAFPITGKYKGF